MQDNNSTRTRLVYALLRIGIGLWGSCGPPNLAPATDNRSIFLLSPSLPPSLPLLLLPSLTAFSAQSKFRSVIEIGENSEERREAHWSLLGWPDVFWDSKCERVV